MAIYSDFRKKGFKGKTYVYALISPDIGCYWRTRLKTFPSKREAVQEKQLNDYVVKMKKTTVRRLKKVHPFKRGWYLRYHLQFRPTVARQAQ